MDPEQKRIEEDLRGIVAGDVLCADADRGLYATDASLFAVRPLVIVRPRTAEDVAATVAWAAQRGVPVHPRGGGSSVCGGSLGTGVVIDCSRFLRRILATDDETVRVQPGVVAASLEAHLAGMGRTFGPDPANATVTTIGGMIGRNSSGSRFPRHGAVRGRILAAQVVLGDGTIVNLAPQAAPAAAGDADAGTAGRAGTLAAGVAEIVARGRTTIARFQPPMRPSHAGYRYDDLVRPDGTVDLPRLLCGAEGTLGIVTEATVRTVPADAATAVGLVLFDSLEKAAEAAVRLRGLGPSACDLFDRRHLALARGTKPAFDLLIPPVAEAGLLVEFAGDDPARCGSRLDDALKLMRQGRRGCLDVRRAEDAIDAAFFWELSRNVVSTLHGVRAAVRPVPFVEDIVVPPPALPDFLRRLQEVLKRQQVTAMVFGHAAHGQLHVRPYVDPRESADRERLEALAEALYVEAVASGGTFGGEQGLGLSRTGFFVRMFPELTALNLELKRLFDPAGTLNPGRVTGDAAAALPFRAAGRPAVPPSPDVEAAAAGPQDLLPVLTWSAARRDAEVDACNGCGTCRSTAAVGRMCPMFRGNPAEEAAPRAKANLLAAVLAGGLDPRELATDAVRDVADTCFNCHQCRSECSAGVDIPALVMELKGAHFAANSAPLHRWLLSRVDTLSAWGGAVRPLANWALANPQSRWLIEKALGIAQGRKLPAFSGNQFLRWAARRGITRPSRRSGPRVLYFLDTYARRHDPLLAQAFVAVLERNGIGVFVDPRQVAAGMPLVSEGDLDGARRLARTNMRVLAEAVRLGYRIVCTEPAAVTCLRHDYPLLLEDDDMERVTAATCDATTFLWELHREGGLRLDFEPQAARVLYHAPCHARAAAAPTPAEHLLRLIPGLAVQAADRGCSGMAGTFGLAREHYRTSLRVGLGLVAAMRDGGVDAGATECSACRIQMEQGTTKPAVHPVKLLAKAYGLLAGDGPHGLDGLLTATSGPLTTT
jgi:FAD/FMN-containing dehydrogenase/Fe-S oxidoreductase